MLLGFLFKVMHWPGAHVLALSGFVLASAGTLLPLLSGRTPQAPGNVVRPVLGLLLYGTGLMSMMQVPGGTLAFYGSVAVAIMVLLSDRTRIELQRWDELRIRGLLVASLLLAMSGVLFKVMHWPSANIQLILGITCGVIWTLVTGLRRKAVA